MTPLVELALMVKRMRDCQKEYFRTRQGNLLAICRDWEKRIDKAVEEILNPPSPGLFDQEQKSQGQ